MSEATHNGALLPPIKLIKTPESMAIEDLPDAIKDNINLILGNTLKSVVTKICQH
jgi:hypothetical protein